LIPKPASFLEFNGFRLDLDGRRLLSPDGSTVDLPARAFDVLLHLIEHRGEDISKERLMTAAWPATVVEENNLNQAITALRRVLGDQRREPRFIMTVPGRGYRFVATVTTPADSPIAKPSELPLVRRRNIWPAVAGLLVLSASAAFFFSRRSPDPAPPADAAITTLAVLPFRPIVPAQSNPALELGMVDVLIGQLGTLPDITVRPLSMVSRYTDPLQDPLEIGRKLAVAAVLEGTLQKEGSRIRVSARLLRVSDGRSLWSGRFDEEMNGIFDVQDSIANLVTKTLASHLDKHPVERPAPRPTSNAEAYQYYASGVFNLQRRDIDGTDAAIKDFEAAIREDPNYALAWALLANVRAMQSAFGILPAQQALADAKRAALRAIELDSELAQAQAAMGQVLVQYEHKYAAGEAYYARARRLNPNVAIVHLWTSINYLFLDRADEALQETLRAQELEPGNLALGANVSRVLYYSRKYEAAADHAQRLLTLVPTFDDARSILGRVRLQQGRVDEALQLFNARTHSSPGSFGDLGRAYARAGRKPEAHAQIEQLREKARSGFGTAYDIASIRALLGEFGQACVALEEALIDHSQSVGFLRIDPDFDSMRDQQCVADVARELYPPPGLAQQD
jgi:DNA-binding winged helix-turn-helix (wHTH) protein/TolB-like protein/tetratricopeptide (TPR) repeat protein